MGYIVGQVTAETPEGRPSEIERLSLLGKDNFDFNTAIGFAERLLEERNAPDNIVVTTDRALQNVSEQHPELDVVWSSHDSPVLHNRYLGLSSEQWKEKEDHSFMSEAQSDKPSVYFDIDGTLGKWYADGRGYSSLEEIIDPANHYFRDIEPHPFMVQLAEELQNRGRDVCIVSAADRDTIRDKMEWVHKNMPFIKDENVFFSPLGADKTKFIKDNAEISVLIDDYNVNLDAWKGQAVKAINTVNSHQDKYPEIDMTAPEAEMLKNRERLDKIERLVEDGAFSEQTIDDAKMSMAESMARQLKNACLVVEDAIISAIEKDEERRLKQEMAQTAYDEASAVYREANGLDDYDEPSDYDQFGNPLEDYEEGYEIDERNNSSMVTKEENGYSVNGQHIDAQAARELVSFIDREYYREDVINQLDSQYGDVLTEKLPEELLNKIVDEYAEARGNSEEWLTHADEAIRIFRNEIEAIQHSPIETYHRDAEDGFKSADGFDITTSDGSTVRIITQKDGKDTTPNMFTQELGQKPKYLGEGAKLSEAAYGEALNILKDSPLVPDNIKKWANDSLETANEMITKLEESGYKSFEMETAIGNIQFEAFPFQGTENVKSIADIDGYTTDSDVITGGGQNIYSYASDIVNAEALQRENELGKIHLQEYFEKNVLPIKDIPYSEMNEDQKDIMGMYSDMHKDYYFHRPHSEEQDVCYQHYLEKEAVKAEAMESDLTKCVMALEEPLIESDGESSPYVHFYAAMYDEGLKNIIDRTAILDKTPDYNSLEDIINTDDAYLNAYLAAYENGEVKLSVMLDGGEHAALVPLTPDEQKAFKELAEQALEKDGGVRGTIHYEDKEALEILQKEVKDNPDGYKMYFSYDEKIASDTIADAFEEYKEMVLTAEQNGTERDYSTFSDYLNQTVYEKWNMFEAQEETLESSFKYGKSQEQLQAVEDYLDRNDMTLSEALEREGFAGVTYDLNDIVGEYKMNIMLTTPTEQNSDMSSIPSMFYEGEVEGLNRLLEGMTQEQREDHFDNALTYVIYQQGHTLPEVAEAFLQRKENNNEFVKSVVEELDEFPSYSMAEMTALVTLDKDGLQVLDQIAKGEGEITFSKNTMIGLYNEWQGTGSQLEIQLEKPLIVPADMVRNVQIEGQKSDYAHGYTVNDVYGLVGECWKGEISKSEEYSKVDEIAMTYLEDVSTTRDIIKEAAQPEKPKVKQQGVEM